MKNKTVSVLMQLNFQSPRGTHSPPLDGKLLSQEEYVCHHLLRTSQEPKSYMVPIRGSQHILERRTETHLYRVMSGLLQIEDIIFPSNPGLTVCDSPVSRVPSPPSSQSSHTGVTAKESDSVASRPLTTPSLLTLEKYSRQCRTTVCSLSNRQEPPECIPALGTSGMKAS